jgi:hypothetical protein
MAGNPPKSTTPSTNTSESPQITSFAPSLSEFTFSAGGCAPSFQPRSPFHNNIPQETAKDRNWSYAVQETPTAQPAAAPSAATPTSADPSNRQIAPLRAKQLTGEEKKGIREEQARLREAASKEARNALRLEKENAFVKEQLQKEHSKFQALKEDLREEQTTKQAKVNELEGSIKAALQRADYHQKAFEGQRKVVARQDEEIVTFRKEYDYIQKALKKKMTEDKQQQAIIKELQSKIEKMAENEPALKVEELQNSINILEEQKDTLNTEFDSLQVRLEATEKKLTDTTVAFRHAQSTITNNDATIKNLERQIVENEEQIENLEQELGQKDNRIRKKDDDIKNRVAEVGNLNSLNKQLRQENTRLKSQNEKLELQVRDNIAEIEVFRETNRDYQELEIALAEVQATAAQLKNEVVSLEHSNSELKARLDENPHSLAGPSGTGSNLESELAESDFAGADEETLFTQNDGDLGDDSAEVTESPEVTFSLEVTTSPEVTPPSVVTTSPEVITSPDITVSPEVTQSPVVTTSPEVTQPPAVTYSPEVTKTNFIKALPIAILKSHNPFECWLQVYVDLWILFIFWFNQCLAISFGGRSIVSSFGSVVKDDSSVSYGSSSSSNGLGDIGGDLRAALEGEHTGASLPAAAIGDVASVVTTTAPNSMDYENLTRELPDFGITILALCFHILFYAVVIVCVANYCAVLHERSLWLKANEITRQYLHEFYKVPFKHEYGKFHELFGPLRFLDVWRYNVHNWAKISRSLPG